MSLQYVLTDAPEREPVSVVDFKTYQRIDPTDQDTIIPQLLAAARFAAEDYTQRQLITASYKLTASAFSPTLQPLFIQPSTYLASPLAYYQNSSVYQTELLLPRPPLQTVDSVKYIDSLGVQQTLDPTLYQIQTVAEPARIAPAYGKSWPIARAQYEAVEVDFTCGYGDDGEAVPAPIKQFILAHASWYYEHRDDDAKFPATLYGLLDPYRLGQFSW
jgi:hypothetical protein